MKSIVSLAVVFALTGCATSPSMWNEHHGEVQLPLYTASNITPEYQLMGSDIKIGNVVDDFGTIRWNAEIAAGTYREKDIAPYIGSYKCSGISTYEGLLKKVACVKN